MNEKSSTMKKPAGKRKLVRPTPEENEQINAGIAADPDTRELTEKDFARMRAAADVHPEIVEAYRRSRGKQKAPTKIATSIRLSPGVLAAYKQTGAGWQRRIDEDLQEIVARRKVKQSLRKRGEG